MKITKRQLKRIIREFAEEELETMSSADILAQNQTLLDKASAPTKADQDLADLRQSQKDRATGNRIKNAAKTRAQTAAMNAGKKMATTKSGRARLADIIEERGAMPAKFRAWVIDGICGAAQDMDSVPDKQGFLGPTAKKICRMMFSGGGGLSTSLKLVTPWIADFLRDMSDEDAAAVWDFGAEMYELSKDEPVPASAAGKNPKAASRPAGPAITAEGKVTKRQLKRIIREERANILKEWFSDEHDPETGERDRYEEFGNFDRYSGQKSEEDPQMLQVQDEIYDLASREVGVGLDELEDMFGGMGIDAAMQAEQDGRIFMEDEVFYAGGSHELSAGPGGTRSYMGESKITKRQLKRIIREWFSDEHDPTTGIRDTLDMATGLEDYEVDEMSSEFYVDQLMKQEYDSGRYAHVDELLGDGAAYEELAMTAMEQYPELSDDEFDLIWNNAGFVDQT